MTNRRNQHLELFLDNLFFDPPVNSSDYEFEIICYPIMSIDIDKNQNPIHFESSEIKVWFKSFDGFSIEALLGIIDSYLKRTNHVRNKSIGLAVFGMYLVLRGDRHDTDYLYEMLENIIKSDVTFYYIFPKISNFTGDKFASFNLGEYHFGKLNTFQMKQYSRRAKSDYFKKYENELQNRIAIERNFKEVTLINWWEYREKRNVELSLISKVSKNFNELSENYFDQVSLALFDIFLKEINDEQDLTTSFGSSYVIQVNRSCLTERPAV